MTLADDNDTCGARPVENLQAAAAPGSEPKHSPNQLLEVAVPQF